MNPRPFLALAALPVLCLFGFLVFPGHTFLQSDTMIYMPMLDRIVNPALYTRDLIATHPHLSFTFYDEIAVFSRWLTGLDFQHVLHAQQLLTRLLGLFGVFLLARAAQLSHASAVLACGMYALGATIAGPAVLTIEYEPVPRGSAIPLLLLSLGLAAHRQWIPAGVAAAAAFLYHPPTVWPVWGVLIVYQFLPGHDAPEGTRRRFLASFALAALVLFVSSKFQSGIKEHQDFFWRVPPDLEALQRMRASYNWIAMWIGKWWVHYAFLLGVALAARARLGRSAEGFLKFALLWLPLLGALSLPLGYLLLDVLKWGLIPQIQVGRAVLFTTLFACLSAALAAGKAAESRRWLEASLWLLVPIATAIQVRPLDLLIPFPWSTTLGRRLLLAVVISLALALLVSFLKNHLAQLAAAAATLAAMYAILHIGHVNNYPKAHSPEIDALSAWAKSNTPITAMFHFPDAAREQYPAIFRVKSQRAVWVEWKGGGQVNFLPSLAYEWWNRFDALQKHPQVPTPAEYWVTRKLACPSPLYSNKSYTVCPNPFPSR
jgi:hypothetical protein